MTRIITVLESSSSIGIGAWIKENVISSSSNLTTSEKLAISGEMVLKGMATVFLVLIILWGIIAIFGAVAKLSSKKESSKEEPSKSAEVVPAVQTNDTEIVAAIIAAIEAYRAEEGLTGMPYRVVSFKKRGQKNRRTDD